MTQLTIDGKNVIIEDGATILDAARSIGISIPTMCHRDKDVSPVSCFVCAVKIDGRDNFVPACATTVRDRMAVDTSSDDVLDCRRRAIELMLGEHSGDCAAPCSRICPCGLDIPEVMRNLLSHDVNAATETIMRYMPFSATLGYICPAPCQKGCRRAAFDSSLSIQMIHRTIAVQAISLSSHNKYAGIRQQSKNIAIIGSGPAGLSAAYFLSIRGYSCTVFESQPQIGGTLRTQFDELTLPRHILNEEINSIEDLGVQFVANRRIGSIDEIYDSYDAIIIAAGSRKNNDPKLSGLEYDSQGIKACGGTFMTNRPKVFACGSAARPVNMAARSVGQGRLTAISVDNYLLGKPQRKPFCMNVGRLSSADTESLLQSIPYTAQNAPGSKGKKAAKQPAPQNADGVNTTDVIGDAKRCLQCGCGKEDSCALRALAEEYGAHHQRYATGQRKPYTRRLYPDSGLVHEPGKCTACGRCVNITRIRSITPGLSFAGRGTDVYVSAPFGADLDKAMGAALDECVKSCPTGALWIRKQGQ